MKQRIIPSLVGAVFFLSADFSSGQDAFKSAEDVARELANPNTPLASLTVKNQFRLFDGSLPGSSGQSGFSMLFQPSLPFALDNGDLLLFRPAVPLFFDQPVFEGDGFDHEFGLGDIAFDLALARTSESGVLTAYGLVSTLPTATSSLLGNGRWSIGPEFLIGKTTEDYVLGIFPNHQWDIAGWTDKSVNLTTVQLFGTFLPGGGWNVGTSPIISYDWEGDQWTVPLNLSFGKTVIIGETPWKISAEVNYFLEKPDTFAADWMFGINLAPVIQNPLAKLFQK